MKKKIGLILIVIASIFLTLFNVSCGAKEEVNKNVLNNPVTVNVVDQKADELTLKVFNVSLKKIVEMPMEEYLQGVVAGEMFNYWNKEALKAQAILARTYTMHFLKNKKSRYANADISTDITEAQAYDAGSVNDAIKKAVAETKGQVLLCDGELINGWFHSNSGGKTTSSKVGLNYADDEPRYIKSVSSPENNLNSKNFIWEAELKKTDILNALRKMGVSVSNIYSFKIGEKSDDGRAVTLLIGGKEVDATTFRINFGSTVMKSTWITHIEVGKNVVAIKGKGYGHGVGMSQWGAQILAGEGKNAEQILNWYFDNVELKTVYN